MKKFKHIYVESGLDSGSLNGGKIKINSSEFWNVFVLILLNMTILIMSKNRMTTEGEKKNQSEKSKHALNQKFPALAHMRTSTGTKSWFILRFRARHSKFWGNMSSWNFVNIRTFDYLAFKPIFSLLYQAGRNPPRSPGFPGFLWPQDPLQNKWSFYLGQVPALLRFLI